MLRGLIRASDFKEQATPVLSDSVLATIEKRSPPWIRERLQQLAGPLELSSRFLQVSTRLQIFAVVDQCLDQDYRGPFHRALDHAVGPVGARYKPK